MRPNKVKIGPFIYTIYWSESKWDEYSKCEGGLEGSSGACFGALQVIVVRGWMLSAGAQKSVLLHEMLHACFDLTQYSHHTTHKNDQEEHTVQILTPALLELLRDNPNIVEWLQSDD